MEEEFVLIESELEEHLIRASGPGGQNVNKVSTKVVLKHLPTGVTVTVQEGRSQAANRKLARERLREALVERERQKKAAAQQEREKNRRRKSPRPRAVKRRMVESKRRRGAVKASRGRVSQED